MFRNRTQPSVVSNAPTSRSKSKGSEGVVHTVAKPAAESFAAPKTDVAAKKLGPTVTGDPASVPMAPPPAMAPMGTVSAEPTSFGRVASGERMDEMLVLSPMLAEAQLLTFPTVVHATHSLAVAAPGRLRRSESGYFERVLPTHSWANSILLVPNDKNAEVRWEPVTNGWATFDEIQPGKFNVYYLKESVPEGDPNRLPIPESVLSGKRVPHRQLVVVNDTSASPLATPVAATKTSGHEFYRQGKAASSANKKNFANELAAARKAKEKPIPETIRGLLDESQLHTDKGWVALEKGNSALALKEFREAITVVAAGIPSTGWKLPETRPVSSKVTWKDLVDGTEVASKALANKELDSATAASILNSTVGNLPQMGRAFYGLAKAYDAMAENPLRTVPNADQFALALCHSSFLLDETQMRVANDLGVMCFNQGRSADAIEYLSYASTYSDDSRIAFNLGRAMWDSRDFSKAREQWQSGMNTRLAEKYALLSMIQVQLAGEGEPINAQECRQLAEDLGKIIRSYNTQSPEATWAQAVLLRLELLAYEIRLNEPSFSARMSVADKTVRPTRAAKPDSRDPKSLPPLTDSRRLSPKRDS